MSALPVSIDLLVDGMSYWNAHTTQQTRIQGANEIDTATITGTDTCSQQRRDTVFVVASRCVACAVPNRLSTPATLAVDGDSQNRDENGGA
jgi:hypothetical protein